MDDVTFGQLIMVNGVMLAGLIVSLCYAIHVGRCGCGKTKRSVFLMPWHPKISSLYLDAVLVSMTTLVAIISQPWFCPVLVVATILDVLKIYYHEKDKWKKAAKALGKVVVNAHGRLKVAPAHG